jgi:CTP:phosphocholine cytidylyltransferase-like protein
MVMEWTKDMVGKLDLLFAEYMEKVAEEFRAKYDDDYAWTGGDAKVRRYIKKHGMKYWRVKPCHAEIFSVMEYLKEGVVVNYYWDSEVMVIIPKDFAEKVLVLGGFP